MFNPLLTSFVCVAVIKQINALERHLDLRLFERTNHGIALTPAGQVIYRHARQMFAASAAAVAEAQEAAGIVDKTFCVGTSILNPCKPFMDLWYQVNDRFPGYRLHIVPFEDDHDGILEQIEALGQKFDFLIGPCDSRQWLQRCNFLPVARCPHCIAVPREHPLACKERLTLADLDGETVMVLRAGDSPAVDRLREELLCRPQVHVADAPVFYDMEVFNRCVQDRCLLVTLSCWADVHPSLVTLPVEWEFSTPFGILYQKDPPSDVARFIETVRCKLAAG